MTAQKLSPAEFVRSLPKASPAEVVAAAAKAGLSLDATYVSKTRGLDKARLARWGAGGAKKAAPKAAKAASASKVAAPAKKAAPPKTVAKKAAPAKKAAAPVAKATPAKKGGAKTNKAEYVRGFGLEVKPADILTRANAAGVALTLQYVYKIRKEIAKKAKAGAPIKRGPGRPPKAQAAAVKAPAPKAAIAKAPAPKGAASKQASATTEHAFVAAALDLGLARAQELLDGVRARVRAISLG